MQDYRININYAKALFLLAGDTGDQERVEKDMRLVNEVFSNNRQLHVVFGNPEVRVQKKLAIIAEIFQSHICKTTMVFLNYVVRKKRCINLKGISAAYIDIYRQHRGIVLTKLTTAAPADDETQRLVTQAIAQHTQKQVELTMETDADAIGGLSIEFENNMYDATIRTQLTKLRRTFEENVYESKL